MKRRHIIYVLIIIMITHDVPETNAFRLKVHTVSALCGFHTSCGSCINQCIFDPFFTTKAPGKGTGLGLSVSRSIIENAGGNMEIKSREGEGSTVSVLLPLADGGDRNE